MKPLQTRSLASIVPRFAAAIALVVATLAAPAAATPSFVAFPNYVLTGVSADGSVVVGYTGSSFSEFSSRAVRWTASGGFEPLGDLPGGGPQSRAIGVSSDGSVVVGWSSATDSYGSSTGVNTPFRWTAAEGMVALPSGSPIPVGVSADGSVVAGSGGNGQGVREAYRWTADGGSVGLGFLPGVCRGCDYPDSYATAISADGRVVVGQSTSSSGLEAFRWTAGDGMVGLGFLPDGWFSRAEAVSADGSVVVGDDITVFPSATAEAFRWTDTGGMVGLGGVPSRASAVSADGSVVLGSSDGVGEAFIGAFIWDATHGTRPLLDVLMNDYGLDLAGWTLGGVTAISADGRTIVGGGISPDHSGDWAWIATIPEPATGLLLLSGLLGLAASRRPRAS